MVRLFQLRRCPRFAPDDSHQRHNTAVCLVLTRTSPEGANGKRSDRSPLRRADIATVGRVADRILRWPGGCPLSSSPSSACCAIGRVSTSHCCRFLLSDPETTTGYLCMPLDHDSVRNPPLACSHVLVFEVGATPENVPSRGQKTTLAAWPIAVRWHQHLKELEDPHGPRSTTRAQRALTSRWGTAIPARWATPSPAKGRHPRSTPPAIGQRHSAWRRRRKACHVGLEGPAACTMQSGPGSQQKKKAKVGRSAHPFSRDSSARTSQGDHGNRSGNSGIPVLAWLVLI